MLAGTATQQAWTPLRQTSASRYDGRRTGHLQMSESQPSRCLSDSNLHRYHARELDEAAEARVREHLAQCEQCARRDSGLVAEHEQLVGRLKGMVLSDTEAAPPESPPEHYTVSLPVGDRAGTADGDLTIPREVDDQKRTAA